METAKLKKFAQFARRSLMDQVSTKLKMALADESSPRREHPKAVKKLSETIAIHGKEQVIERVAYIWFNRFCALRFMDVNRYTRIGVVSPAEGQFQPEILAEAKMGHIDEEMVPANTRQEIFSLLNGKSPSPDPQGEVYRLLLVAACNFWNKAMPFLFQHIDDYTELLMPDDLLSGNSILTYTREAMTPDACEDVEVIGWLYQFYISEKKDEVFDGLKKNKKITPENIPAATQLFTPHWIVRYLVENSLGRLWLLNRPASKLIEQMDYYIKPEQAETDFLRISKPEEIKICDPACGSGHMLTYAFDLLYAIYEEQGYEPAEIPEKILTNNLYGIEIDERAGELAAFALTMKARAKQRRFFNKGVKPNICVLENVHFDDDELKNYMDFVGRDLFTAPLQTTLRQFEEADNFGSLIRPDVTDVDGMLSILESKNVSGQLFIGMTHQKVLQALRQADYLSPKYHVVIANPPYMGAKGMNPQLTSLAKAKYPSCWDRGNSDLFALFIERNLGLAKSRGLVSMITMQTWMFLSSFEKLRLNIVDDNTILSMAHLGARAFDSIGGEVVSTTAFVISNVRQLEYEGSYIRLVDGGSESEKNATLLRAVKSNDVALCRASSADFRKIPGAPIAYWLSDTLLNIFENESPLSEFATPRQGLATSDNNRFVRTWSEVPFNRIGFCCADREEAMESRKRWFPFNKGGSFRRWGGNAELVVNWENDGADIKDSILTKYPYLNGNPDFVAKNPNYYFKPGLTWSALSSGLFSIRFQPKGFIFADKGQAMFPFKRDGILNLEGLLNSKVVVEFLKAISPTLDFNAGYIAKVPCHIKQSPGVSRLNSGFLSDWDSYETSWDFTSLPLLNPDYLQPTLKATYQKLHAHWQETTLEMQRLEEENNRIFIDAYGLQDELTPEVPLGEITLTCNPHYRYGNDKSEDELEALLLADTMRELASYAVGCMFGRYALDKPGLILANQGETIEDYLKRVPEPSFPADDDNVIPMLDGDWFTDDIAERFRKFLRVTFGEEHYEDNLRFVEQALNIKGKRSYSIRDYFLGEFYPDHVKRYKKRPIYWLFSSPKGSFNALIYMHRYRSDTVSVLLNKYLREFRTKLTSRRNFLEAFSISASSSQGEKTKALKEIEKITKMIAEMEEYEREVLYPLATQQVEIDLDDGVKVNYPKLGAALKKIPGLDAKED
ncbi:MAG: BREX-1 system adenine-specific DNA-methyltransferase PglX [Acidobacteria bacterium]|nr:BREX-1 system adenine-specific DNA-methyltransferase PglX [Acidobacteriota bacterium]